MNDDTPDPYTLPDTASHPADIAARLMRLPEHLALSENEVEFGWLMRTTPKEKGGKITLGSVHDTGTMAQGGFKDLFTMMLERLLGTVPAYVIVIDAAWWGEASAIDREILVFQMLLKCRQATDIYGAPKFDKEGNPVWKLYSPDVEEFTATIQRYGAHNSVIGEFVSVANGKAQNSTW